jgi:hypothetical protein
MLASRALGSAAISMEVMTALVSDNCNCNYALPYA